MAGISDSEVMEQDIENHAGDTGKSDTTAMANEDTGDSKACGKTLKLPTERIHRDLSPLGDRRASHQLFAHPEVGFSHPPNKPEETGKVIDAVRYSAQVVADSRCADGTDKVRKTVTHDNISYISLEAQCGAEVPAEHVGYHPHLVDPRGVKPPGMLRFEGSLCEKTLKSDFSYDHERKKSNEKCEANPEDDVLLSGIPSAFPELNNDSNDESCHLPGEWNSQKFTNHGGTFKVEESDIILNIPLGALSQGMEHLIHRWVCPYPELFLKKGALVLETGEEVISPIVEYSINAVSKTFMKPVTITLPHIAKDLNKIKVWYGNLKEGEMLQCAKHKSKEVESSDKREVFFTADTENVYIHTTHFTVFVCTECNDERNIRLCAMCFGKSEGEDDLDITLRIYICHVLYTLPDYQKVIKQWEEEQGLKLCNKKQIDTNNDLKIDGNTELTIEVTLHDGAMWAPLSINGFTPCTLKKTSTASQLNLCTEVHDQPSPVAEFLLSWTKKEPKPKILKSLVLLEFASSSVAGSSTVSPYTETLLILLKVDPNVIPIQVQNKLTLDDLLQEVTTPVLKEYLRINLSRVVGYELPTFLSVLDNERIRSDFNSMKRSRARMLTRDEYQTLTGGKADDFDVSEENLCQKLSDLLHESFSDLEDARAHYKIQELIDSQKDGEKRLTDEEFHCLTKTKRKWREMLLDKSTIAKLAKNFGDYYPQYFPQSHAPHISHIRDVRNFLAHQGAVKGVESDKFDNLWSELSRSIQGLGILNVNGWSVEARISEIRVRYYSAVN